MKRNRTDEVNSELQLAGASRTEALDLADLATSFGRLAQRHRRPPWLSRLTRYVPVTLAVMTWTVTGVGLCIAAQTSLPGDNLYPVKTLSESAAVAVNPEYRQNIMLHRVNDVHMLVDKNAPAPIILDTLKSYQEAAREYEGYEKREGEKVDANSPLLNYCKETLEIAAANSTGYTREAITQAARAL